MGGLGALLEKLKEQAFIEWMWKEYKENICFQ